MPYPYDLIDCYDNFERYGHSCPSYEDSLLYKNNYGEPLDRHVEFTIRASHLYISLVNVIPEKLKNDNISQYSQKLTELKEFVFYLVRNIHRIIVMDGFNNGEELQEFIDKIQPLLDEKYAYTCEKQNDTCVLIKMQQLIHLQY